jgi:hypothetical protein
MTLVTPFAATRGGTSRIKDYLEPADKAALPVLPDLLRPGLRLVVCVGPLRVLRRLFGERTMLLLSALISPSL